jgi:hypothetical protein
VIFPVSVDVDRLHAAVHTIVSGGYRYRKQGTTLRYLMLLLGEFQLGEDNSQYLYVTNGWSNLGATTSAFRSLLTAEQLLIDTRESDRSFEVVVIHNTRGQKFVFTTVLSYEAAVSGNKFHRVFLDVDDRSMDAYNREGSWQPLATAILSSLVIPNGDIV